MDVVVRSSSGHLPMRVRNLAERKLDRLSRSARDVSRVEMHLSEERNPRIAGRHVCAVTVRLRHGSVVARAAAPTRELALDRVVAKLRHQLERRKDARIKAPHAAARRAGRLHRTRS